MSLKLFTLAISILLYVCNTDSYTLNTIYYINFASHLKRRKGILEQINKIQHHFSNVKVEIIEPVLCNENISWYSNVLNFGVNPNKLIPKTEDIFFTNSSDITSMTKLACQVVSIYLSHLDSLKQIRRKHLKNTNSSSKEIYMVFEDDVMIGKKFLRFLNKLIVNGANAPQPWYLIKAFIGKHDKSHLVNNYYYNMTMAKHLDYSYYFGMHCLIYNADFVGNIIEQLDKIKYIANIDFCMDKNVNYLYAVGSNGLRYMKSKSFVTLRTYDGERGVHSHATSNINKPQTFSLINETFNNSNKIKEYLYKNKSTNISNVFNQLDIKSVLLLENNNSIILFSTTPLAFMTLVGFFVVGRKIYASVYC